MSRSTIRLRANGDPAIRKLIQKAIERSGKSASQVAAEMQRSLGLRVPVKNLLAYTRWHPAWEQLFCDVVQDWSVGKAFGWHRDYYRALLRTRQSMRKEAIEELGPEVFADGWPN